MVSLRTSTLKETSSAAPILLGPGVFLLIRKALKILTYIFIFTDKKIQKVDRAKRPEKEVELKTEIQFASRQQLLPAQFF